jgi:hypothetical protein
MRRGPVALLSVGALWCLGPASAQASTQFGETFPPSGVTCGKGFTALQPEYTSPVDGVITSFSWQGPDVGPGSWKLKVARPGAPGVFTTVGESGLVGGDVNRLNSFPARISIEAGDVLGVYTDYDYACARVSGSYQAVYTNGDVQPGQSAAFADDWFQYQLDLSATVESDSDHDGFGDETQDKCIGLVGPRDGCAVPPARCFGKRPTIIGTNRVDHIVGTAAADVISARRGNDTISGVKGNDLICGGGGDDTLRGGKGNDTLGGGAAADRMLGGPGDDRLFGGTPGAPPASGDDRCDGQGGSDREQNCESVAR